MTFDQTERAILAGLADVLIPAGDGFPSASAAGVADQELDKVLSFRPDFAAGLKKLLASTNGRPPAEVIDDLRQNDPAGYGLLSELVPGAYFLNAEVRAKLDYHGQIPRPIDPQPDYSGLLQSVLDRGPIYRPTPK